MGQYSKNPKDKKAEKKLKAEQAKAGKIAKAENAKAEKARLKSVGKSKNSIRSKNTLYFYLLVLFSLWTGALSFFYLLDIKDAKEKAEGFVTTAALVAIEKDASYYQWQLNQGKLYRLDSSNKDPNGNTLSNEAANNESAVRKPLKAVTADEVLSQTQSEWRQKTGALLEIFNSDNRSLLSGWELESFQKLETGKESKSITRSQKAGKEWIQVMLPIYSGSMCVGLGCENSNISLSDKVVAALMLSLPMTSELQLLDMFAADLKYRYGSIWFIGLVVFFIGNVHLKQNFARWDKEVIGLERRMSEHAQVLNLRTQEVLRLQKNNQDFIENIDAAVYYRNRDNTFSNANSHFIQAIGAKQFEDLIGGTGERFLDNFLTDYLHQHEQMAIKHEESVETGDFELAFGGTVRGIIFPTRGIYGQIDGVAAVFTPLTATQTSVHYGKETTMDDSGMGRSTSSSKGGMVSSIKTKTPTGQSKYEDLDFFSSSKEIDEPLINIDSTDDLPIGTNAQLTKSDFDFGIKHSELIGLENDIDDKQSDQEGLISSRQATEAMKHSNAYVGDSSTRSLTKSSAIESVRQTSNEDFAFVGNSTRVAVKDEFAFGSGGSTSTAVKDEFAFGSGGSTSTAVKDEFAFGSGGSTSTVAKDEFAFGSGGSTNTVAKDEFAFGRGSITSSSEQAKFISEGVSTSTFDDENLVDLTGTQTLEVSKPIISDSDESKVTKLADVEKSKVLLNILLVDDSEADRDEIKVILQQLGHMVSTADNGYQAVEMQGWGTFDIVFMDIQMPVMNGIQATAHIRKQERLNTEVPRTPIIALANSEGGMSGDLDTYRSCGMDNFVVKPIQIEKLTTIINAIIDEFKLKGLTP